MNQISDRIGIPKPFKRLLWALPWLSLQSARTDGQISDGSENRPQIQTAEKVCVMPKITARSNAALRCVQAWTVACLVLLGAGEAKADSFTSYTLDSALQSVPDFFDPTVTDHVTENIIWNNTTNSVASANFTISNIYNTYVAPFSVPVDQSGLSVVGNYLTQDPNAGDLFLRPDASQKNIYMGYGANGAGSGQIFAYGDAPSLGPYAPLTARIASNGNYILADAVPVPVFPDIPRNAVPAGVPVQVAPCDGCLFHNYGGPVLLGTKDVYFLFYGNNFGSDPIVSQLPDFINRLAGTDYLNLLTQFTDIKGTPISPSLQYKASIHESAYLGNDLSLCPGDPSNPVYSCLGAGTNTIITDALNSNKLPTDPNAIYVLVTDPTVTGVIGPAACAYHTSTAANLSASVTVLPLINSYLCSPTYALSHELMESITDPVFPYSLLVGPAYAWHGSGGVYGSNVEIADVCRTSVSLPGTGYDVQAIFVPTAGNNTTGYTGYCSSGVSLAAVPEPAALPLLAAALTGLGLIRSARHRRGNQPLSLLPGLERS